MHFLCNRTILQQLRVIKDVANDFQITWTTIAMNIIAQFIATYM